MPIDLSALVLRSCLAFLRIGSIFVFIPLPGFQNAPAISRLVAALAITVATAPAWLQSKAEIGSYATFTGFVLAEVVLGLTLGLAVLLLTETLTIAGQLISMQAGFSYATTIDPSSQTDTGILPLLWQLMGGTVLLALGVDRQFLKAIAGSFDICPAGTWIATTQNASVLIKYGAQVLTFSCRIALPVVSALILLDLLLATVTRVSAQVQLLSLAFPLKILASLVLIAFGLRFALMVYSESVTTMVGLIPVLLRSQP